MKTATPRAEWLTLSDAAAYTSSGTRTVRRWVAEGKLPAYRLGGQLRIKRSDIDALFRRIPAGGAA